MLSAPADAGEIQADGGDALCHQGVDQGYRQLGVVVEIFPGAVTGRLGKAGIKGYEHPGLHPVQIQVLAADVPALYAADIKDYAGPFSILQRKFLVHHIEMGAQMAHQHLLLVALGVCCHFGCDFQRDVDLHNSFLSKRTWRVHFLTASSYHIFPPGARPPGRILNRETRNQRLLYLMSCGIILPVYCHGGGSVPAV